MLYTIDSFRFFLNTLVSLFYPLFQTKSSPNLLQLLVYIFFTLFSEITSKPLQSFKFLILQKKLKTINLWFVPFNLIGYLIIFLKTVYHIHPLWELSSIWLTLHSTCKLYELTIFNTVSFNITFTKINTLQPLQSVFSFFHLLLLIRHSLYSCFLSILF